MIQGRLVEFMSFFKLTAVVLAENIGVQPSSVSHILSGRNKPSLDFVNKLLSRYPQVSFDWLVNGKGNMLKTENESRESPNLFSESESSYRAPEEPQTEQEISESKMPAPDARRRKSIAKIPKTDAKEADKPQNSTLAKTISRIIVFYSDNTFEEFGPKND